MLLMRVEDYPKINKKVAEAILKLVNYDIAEEILNQKDNLSKEAFEILIPVLEEYVNWDRTMLSRINLTSSYELANLYASKSSEEQKEISESIQEIYITLLKLRPILESFKTEEDYSILLNRLVDAGIDSSYIQQNKSVLMPKFYDNFDKNNHLKHGMTLILGLYEGVRSKSLC